MHIKTVHVSVVITSARAVVDASQLGARYTLAGFGSGSVLTGPPRGSIATPQAVSCTASAIDMHTA